jgi:hypothetical protein
MDRATLEHRAPHRRPPAGAERILLHEGSEFRRDVVRGRQPLGLPVGLVDDAALGMAQAARVLDEGFEDRLQVERLCQSPEGVRVYLTRVMVRKNGV